MKKLYIKHDNGEFEQIAGFIHSPLLKEIKKTKISKAFEKYIDIYSTKKSPDNLRNEKKSFADFTELMIKNDVEYVDDIDPPLVERYISTLLKRMKPSSVNRRMCSFRHFFNVCIDWKYIIDSPMKKIKPLRYEKNHFKPWSDEQYEKFIALCDQDYSRYFKFLRVTGARPIEAQNITWDDINWDKKEIYLKSKKNAKIKRTFPLTLEVEKLITSFKKLKMFIFTCNGEQIKSDNAYQYASHRLKKLGFKNLVPYGFRHTFANKLNQSRDFDAFDIKDLLGHSDIKTTLNYVTVNQASNAKKINKVKF